MINQTKQKDEDRTLLFLGNPRQLKEACAGNQTKLKFVTAVQTLLEWKASVQRAKDFLESKSPEIRELEGQLWQEIADADRVEWPALKILKSDGDKCTAVYAHRSGQITIEEVKIDEQ